MLATTVERWKRNWLQEGEQNGRQEGEAALLLRLLERRFGPLPGWAMDRVRAAEPALLEDWGMRLLEASSLDAVLGEPPR